MNTAEFLKHTCEINGIEWFRHAFLINTLDFQDGVQIY